MGKWLTGALLTVGGIAVAIWGPGTPPATGVAALLSMLGLLVLAMAAVPLILARTTRPEDYQGTCPVGESCKACGSFNYKPRRVCRTCDAPVNASEAS